MKPGQEMIVNIIRVTRGTDGVVRGVAISEPPGWVVIVDGVEEDDKEVSLEIRKVYEKVLYGVKKGRIQRESERDIPGTVDSPYEVDEDEEDE